LKFDKVRNAGRGGAKSKFSFQNLENKKVTMEGGKRSEGVSLQEKKGGEGDRPSYRFTIEPKGSNFYVTIHFKSPTTGRSLKKKFAILIAANAKKKELWTRNVVAGAVLRYFEHTPRAQVMNMRSKRELGSSIYQIVKRLSSRVNATEALSQLEASGKRYVEGGSEFIPFASKQHSDAIRDDDNKDCGEEEGDYQENAVTPLVRQRLEKIALPLPSVSAFKPEETGRTYAVVGKSFCGKTTFIVNNLNLLKEDELNQYNAIFYFTSSTNAKPLEGLSPEVKKRFILVPRWIPKIIKALKRINDKTKLMFKFLVFFDDIINLGGNVIADLILTLRNSNISTVLSVQDFKMMTPAQRNSIHHLYIFQQYPERWEFILKGFLSGSLKEKLPPLKPIRRTWEMCEIMKDVMNPFIIFYNQIQDELTFYNKGFNR
jgi:hypothetical protein